MTLKELKIGDKFYPKSKATKATPIFEVIGEPLFSLRHGRPVRMCMNLKERTKVSKSCSLEIIHINSNQ